MIKEGLEYLCDMARDAVKAERVMSNDREEVYMTASGKLVTIEKKAPLPHEFLIHSMADFVAWVKFQTTCASTAWIDVAADSLNAKALVRTVDDRLYTSIHEWRHTPEWKAMLATMGMQSQKSLWMALSGDLRHCFPAELRMALGSIKLSASRESEFSIQDSGLTTGKAAESVAVEFAPKGDPKNTQRAEIPIIWEYQGPVYKGLEDREYALELRLFIEDVNGRLAFHLNPLGMARFNDGVLEDLIGDLREALKDVRNVAVFNATKR